jgi:hypothetical protein
VHSFGESNRSTWKSITADKSRGSRFVSEQLDANHWRRTQLSAARPGKYCSPMNLNAIPVSSESIVRRFRLRPVYGVFLWLWIATSLAHAERGFSSSETARTHAFDCQDLLPDPA